MLSPKKPLHLTLITTLLLISTAFSQGEWTDKNDGAPSGFTQSGNTVYAKRGILVSEDEGKTWTANTAIFKDQEAGTKAGGIVFVTSTGRLLTTRGKNAYHIVYSDDKGATWTQTESHLQASLAHAAETDGVIYLHAPNIPIYSKDNGATWTQVPLAARGGVSGTLGKDFQVPQYDSIAIVTAATMEVKEKFAKPDVAGITKSSGENYFLLKKGKLFHTSDKSTWKDISPPKDQGSFVPPVITDVVVKNGSFYVTSSTGTYTTADKGATWKKLVDGAMEYLILTDNYIIGGRNFRGQGHIVRFKYTSGTQISSNPTSELSIIPQSTSITAYDLLGNSTKLRLDENGLPNTKLTPGIYFIKSQNQTKKLYVR